MSLLDKAYGLSTELKSYKSYQQNAHRVETFAERLEHINEAKSKLDVSTEKFNLFKDNDFGAQIDEEKLNECRKLTTVITDHFSDNNESIVGNPQRFKGFLNSIKTLSNDIDNGIASAWASYYSEHAQTGLNYDVAKSFAQTAGSDRTLVRQIREQREQFETAESVPSDASAFVRFEELLVEREKLAKKLPEISDEIRRFMTRTSSTQGMLLSELNDDILKWLRENDLLKSFKITSAFKRELGY